MPNARDAAYLSALHKLALYERPNPAEERELRRRRLDDGTYPWPVKADGARRLGFHLRDPRTARAES